jgi:hypothetical protein
VRKEGGEKKGSACEGSVPVNPIPNPNQCYSRIVCLRCVCYYCSTYYKTVRVGGRRIVEDMCYEIRRAEACVD